MRITYQTKNTHPRTLPSATIHMGGLLCLSFDGHKRCTVGVNKVGGGHTWKFWIVEQDQESGNRILDLNEGNSNLREIHIDVTGGATGGPYVFNGKGAVSISTSKEHRFNLESSWIDLEGPRGHNKPVENNPNTLWPRFYINEGLFCASKLSTGLFSLRDSNPTPLIKPLGKVALEVVADIFLDTSNPLRKIEVKLSYETNNRSDKTVERAQKTVSLDNNKRYQIYITNDCDSVGPYFYSDFPLHYKSFSGAFNGSLGIKAADQFQLVPDNASAKSKTESMLVQAGDDYSDTTDWATDRAPCMCIALGRTRAFKA